LTQLIHIFTDLGSTSRHLCS